MIYDKDLENYTQEEILQGKALCWVIDGDVLYDLPLIQKYIDLFTGYNNIIDVSKNYPTHNGITVQFLKNDEILEEFNTSEYFGSILLSNPQVLDLGVYPYGQYVISPNAKFDGEKFIILDQDVTEKDPWYHGK
jgi:hypothetical protein